jgi:serine/threonine-protein kinase
VILEPGDTLHNGQYRVAGLLDRGAYGYLYQAEDTLTGAPVAIKELVPALVGDKVRLERCLTDARAARQLVHDHIVPILEIFHEGGDSETRNVYVVTEFMPLSLEAWLQAEGALPPVEALRIAAGVSLGLDCAHEQGLVHGGLKPANILLTADPHPGSGALAKVADFGVAWLSEDPLTRSWDSPEGFVAGSQPYVAPEQVGGAGDDPRVDVYGLGAVLYRMLTGRTYLAFNPQETPSALAGNVYLIQNEAPEPPSTHAPDVPSWLDTLVLKALAKQPADRYAGAGEFRAALLAGLERFSAEMAPVEPQPAEEAEPVESELEAPTRSPEHERKKRRRGLVLALAGVLALVLLAAAIAALALSGSFQGAPTPISRQPRTAAAVTPQAPRVTSTVERPSATGPATRRTPQARASASTVSEPTSGVSLTPTAASGPTRR